MSCKDKLEGQGPRDGGWCWRDQEVEEVLEVGWGVLGRQGLWEDGCRVLCEGT